MIAGSSAASATASNVSGCAARAEPSSSQPSAAPTEARSLNPAAFANLAVFAAVVTAATAPECATR